MMLESYADKIESYARIELKTFLKTGFAQIFSCCPKNLGCPKCPGPYVYVCPFKNCPDLRKGRLKVRSVLIQDSIGIRQVLVTERSLQILRRTYQPQKVTKWESLGWLLGDLGNRPIVEPNVFQTRIQLVIAAPLRQWIKSHRKRQRQFFFFKDSNGFRVVLIYCLSYYNK